MYLQIARITWPFPSKYRQVIAVTAGGRTLGTLLPPAGRGTTWLMWLTTALLGRNYQTTILTECPKGHERTLTFDERTPEQDWVLTCPLCGAEHEIVAPQILRSDL